ncbi:MAG: DoxX family protein [Longimicrobiales bacterium]
MSTIAVTRSATSSDIDSSRGRGVRALSDDGSLPAPPRLSAALAALRLVVGSVFLTHGAQKIFIFGFGGVISAFEAMGVPMAAIAGPMVALVELFGGLALILGFFTRPAAVGLAGVMLGAILTVHLPAGFFLPDGMELVLNLFGAAVTLVLAGPGAYSVDTLRARRRELR